MPTALRIQWESKGATATFQRKSEDDSAYLLPKQPASLLLLFLGQYKLNDDVNEASIRDMTTPGTAFDARTGLCSQQWFMEKEVLTKLREKSYFNCQAIF